MRCNKCHREAKHYHTQLCDHHMGDLCSTQFITDIPELNALYGNHIPYKKLFKYNMEQRGLWKKDGESLGSWHKRLSEAGTASRHLSSLGLALPE